MDITAIRQSLSQFLGLPRSAILESSGVTAALTDLALDELAKLVTLPKGYILTRNVSKPEKGDYFLDIESLTVDERVVIYRATGEVKATQLLLSKKALSPHTIKPTPNTFDFLVCMLQGGQAVYKNRIVLVTAPIIDASGAVAVLVDGKYKVIAADMLRNVSNDAQKDAPNLWDMFNEAVEYDDDYEGTTYDESEFNDYSAPPPKSNKPSPYRNRLNIHFDDTGFDPFLGLN